MALRSLQRAFPVRADEATKAGSATVQNLIARMNDALSFLMQAFVRQF
ncbi:MAG: hypothetical protein VX640_15535 [Pseudomonadota bacterium]|nr:hypothetical protein [Pseudomonadota bacterium]